MGNCTYKNHLLPSFLKTSKQVLVMNRLGISSFQHWDGYRGEGCMMEDHHHSIGYGFDVRSSAGGWGDGLEAA